MNKQISKLYPVLLLLVFNILQVQAHDFDTHSVLKNQYLSKFRENQTTEDQDEILPEEIEPENLRRYPLSERMTPLRIRTILIRFLCPECAKKKNRENTYKLHYNTDVWSDTQVFQITGKAHIYDAAFPATTLLGEVYGAWLLVAGATWNTRILEQRQQLIRLIQQSGQVDQLQKLLADLQPVLTSGLAIFDRSHPFNTLAKANIFIEEVVAGEWIQNSEFSSAAESYFGWDRLNHARQTNQRLFNQNLRGDTVKTWVYTPYITGLMALGIGGQYYLLSRGVRALEYKPWQGCSNCVGNIMKLGGYTQFLTIPVALIQSVFDLYNQHGGFKNVKEVLSDELMAIKPFLQALFAFRDVHNLPLINFTLTGDEQIILDNVLSKIDLIRVDSSHFFHNEIVQATSALRWLLLLRGTIVRYMANVARLDFYISVAEGVRKSSRWSFAEYDTNYQRQEPKLIATQLWNPVLSPEKAVSSNLYLGGKQPASVVLTGANASGKSTFLRGLGINAIFMAQTLGVAAAKEFKLRPFTHFDSLMEKRDKTGRSSYETEVELVARVYGVNSQLSKKHRSLILADELFRTTNPHEGAAASKILVENLGGFPHVSLLVSTHFKNMRELADEYPKLFANKHMSVEIDDQTNEITKMNYRLKSGPSPSRNAIQLFERKMRGKYPELFED